MDNILEPHQQALFDYVCRASFPNSPLPFNSLFPLDAFLSLLPAGRETHLIHILTNFDSKHPEFEQPVTSGLLTSAADFVRRLASLNAPNALNVIQQLRGITSFEAGVNIIRPFASTILGMRREAGVSLYHEFKMLSAVVHAAFADPQRLADGFTLISGDFPGIQKTIYTVGSDGATKGVRGRSFFLQLLADCTVRRLLQTCGNLPITNALVVAGGNFTILAPAGYEDELSSVAAHIEGELLKLFYGDLSLTVTCVSVPADVISSSAVLAEAYGRLKPLEAHHKTQPFASARWENLFEVYGNGIHDKGEQVKETCVVCQREALTPEEQQEVFAIRQANASNQEQTAWTCPTCRIFRELAEDLAKAPIGYLALYDSITNPLPPNLPDYTRKLAELSGWGCRITENLNSAGDASSVLHMNHLTFNPAQADGFRLFAVHTPLVTRSDVTTWHERDEWQQAMPEGLHVDAIAQFDLLARRNSNNMPCLGYLRMDVDSLGALFQTGLQPHTFTRHLAASDAMSLFFEGYLPELCANFEREHNRSNSLYLLYGGGDDLFIVGEWELLPGLATRIRHHFGEYTNQQVTISAGVILVSPGFPFYRAADLAHDALEAAKNLRPEKDSICFLDEPVDWTPGKANWWDFVCRQCDDLVNIAEAIKSDTITRNVQNIHQIWETNRPTKNGRAKRIYYGRYMWLAAYQMSRVAASYRGEDESVKAGINGLQDTLLHQDSIAYSGMIARWAEYRRRVGKEEG